jgi:hypothetical protein
MEPRPLRLMPTEFNVSATIVRREEHTMKKQFIIAYRNDKGGVAKTTLVSHTLFLGAELGLKVAGVSLDGA